MGNSAVDLSKLKKEIHSRKQVKGEVVDGKMIAPKDKFLNGLVESLQTGRETDSTQLLRMVENKTAQKTGEKPIMSGGGTMSAELNKHSTQVGGTPAPSINPSPESMERDAKLFEEFERKRKELISGGVTNIGQHTTVAVPSQQQGGFITEAKLHEAVNNVITEKFAIVVEQAMKDSIVEIYAAARMKEVLEENKEVIKNIVVEVIRGLQTKKKPQ